MSTDLDRGANTDLLGRRWFLVAGNLICFVGHIVVGTAKNTNSIIAGMAIIGFGAANAQIAAFAVAELLPNKWRHIGVVLADAGVYIVITVLPVTARHGFFVTTWRANYYASAAGQGLSFLGLLLFYFPPAHPSALPYSQVFRELDYIGMLLFIAGGTPILVGIVYASIVPSVNAHVVAPLVVGFVFLVLFALWETYGHTKHPLTPTKIFTSSHGRDFSAPCIALAIVNMFYYSSSILWPTMINAWYTNSTGTDWRRAAVLSLPQGLSITLGGVLLSVFGSRIKNWQWQQTVAITILVLFGALLALATPNNMGLMIAFLFLSLLGFGWANFLCIAVCQLGVPQEQLGTSGGLAGVARFGGGAISQAIYVAIFTSTVTKWTGNLLPAAAEAAGLPASKVPELLSLFGTAKFATTYDAAVVAAVGAAYKEVIRKGVYIVALVSLPFGIIGIIASLCCKDIDSRMDNKIEVFLENTEQGVLNKNH